MNHTLEVCTRNLMQTSLDFSNINKRERERASDSDLFSFKNLLKAYYQCRKRKRNTANATKIELNFEEELLKLEKELKNHTYKPGKSICFVVTKPKPREIFAVDFRDRIVHHLLVNFLEPFWEKKFIFHSYACRKNKGAHRAIEKLKKILSSSNWTSHIQEPYYLQIDIESFFMNIDKNILFNLIRKHVKNPQILWLAKLIIFQIPTRNFVVRGNFDILESIPKNKSLFYASENKGLPIGNYTSQFFANLYLNEVDQFIKHKLKCRYYFRYMDDLLLIHQDRHQLKIWQNKISSFLQKNLKLNLHPKKIIMQPICHGIDFLGYIVKPDYTLSRQRIVNNLKKKLYYFNKLINPQTDPQPEKISSFQMTLFQNRYQINNKKLAKIISQSQATVNSYFGHFKYANTLSLRKKLYFQYFKELKNFLQPADKNFSYFEINKNRKSSTPSNFRSNL